MVEVSLAEIGGRPCFSVLRETLTRVGQIEDGVLTQVVHILHKRGRYYLAHWKQLDELDGADASLEPWDLACLEKVASMMDEYGLCHPVAAERIEGVRSDVDRNVFLAVARREEVDDGRIRLARRYPL